MIPLKYNLRNLWVRRVTTGMTVLGTAAVVACSCTLFGMVEGLRYSQKISGDPLDLIVLRPGADTETTSGFDMTKADEMATLDGISRDENGTLLFAKEQLSIPVVERSNGSRANIIVRGVSPASAKLRPKFTIVEGRNFEPSKGECIVSRTLSKRFKGANLGGTLRCSDKESYRVVGLFTAGGSAAESEVWVDIKDLARNNQQESAVNCVQLRATTSETLIALKNTIQNDTRFKLAAKKEADYFEAQTRSTNFLQFFGSVIAVFLTFGAMFAAANTMYSAVSSRTREIGTMRALGFARRDMLICFLGESIILSAMGGALGLLATLPLSAISFGTLNFDTFTESTVNFRLGPTVMIVAVGMTAAMGILGGLFPAIRAVRLQVISALREL